MNDYAGRYTWAERVIAGVEHRNFKLSLTERNTPAGCSRLVHRSDGSVDHQLN
jgi:hypothetical protein